MTGDGELVSGGLGLGGGRDGSGGLVSGGGDGSGMAAPPLLLFPGTMGPIFATDALLIDTVSNAQHGYILADGQLVQI